MLAVLGRHVGHGHDLDAAVSARDWLDRDDGDAVALADCAEVGQDGFGLVVGHGFSLMRFL